jgi:hypothetical protein
MLVSIFLIIEAVERFLDRFFKQLSWNFRRNSSFFLSLSLSLSTRPSSSLQNKIDQSVGDGDAVGDADCDDVGNADGDAVGILINLI